MRKQIAAANWKMNLTLQQGEELLDAILAKAPSLKKEQEVIIAVPFPYLLTAQQKVEGRANFYIAAENVSSKKAGAYTGEVSAEMLKSLGITHTLVGHSERREYFKETNAELAAKVDLALENGLTVVFCCGEPLEIREAGTQNAYVAKQIEESLFHLSAEQIKHIVVAYEPIWAIGTGKTASSKEAEEIQASLRSEFAKKYGKEIADDLTILYGGSVKAANAKEIFSEPDVDGGLVGGASLKADEFVAIIEALK